MRVQRLRRGICGWKRENRASPIFVKEQTRAAIVDALYRHQDPDRHWDPVTMPSGESTNQHLGGYTALVCLAMITAGESYQDQLNSKLARMLDVRIPNRGRYAAEDPEL